MVLLIAIPKNTVLLSEVPFLKKKVLCSVLPTVRLTPNTTCILYCLFAFSPLEGNTEHQTALKKIFDAQHIWAPKNIEKTVQKGKIKWKNLY